MESVKLKSESVNNLFFSDMKFKKLSKSQIIISLDRLTRFKPTEEKYLRVFGDIILSSLIQPKIKKSELLNMDYELVRDIAVEIFNGSFEGKNEDFSINEKLKQYESDIFEINPETQKLLENKLNYCAAVRLIDDNTDILNLKWLKRLGENSDIKKIRYDENFMFPIEKVIIAEGITEEILLPVFSAACGYDFYKNGVKIIPAGGKNQVVKLYYKLSGELKLPIFILLDKDAESNEELINTRLRKHDRVYLLESGEFEDLLPKELIIKTVNTEFKNFVKIGVSDLDSGMTMVKTLEELFKDKCLHEFKKAEFAQRVKQQIKSVKDVSDELFKIISELQKF